MNEGRGERNERAPLTIEMSEFEADLAALERRQLIHAATALTAIGLTAAGGAVLSLSVTTASPIVACVAASISGLCILSAVTLLAGALTVRHLPG